MWSSTIVHILIIIGVTLGAISLAIHKSDLNSFKKTSRFLLAPTYFYIMLIVSGSMLIAAASIERLNTGNSGVFLTVTAVVCVFIIIIALHDVIHVFKLKKTTLSNYIRIKH